MFIEALIREIGNSEGGKVDTIFFGGGTPSLLKEHQLDRIFNTIYKTFTIDENAEITIEANPEDVIPYKLRIWKSFGINRISVGVQTFKDEGLKILGRWHTPKQCMDALKNSLNYGFNTNADIIFAYPEQTLKDFERDLIALVNLRLHHISAYSLQIEEKTLYHYWYKKGDLNLPENLKDFYVLRDEILTSYGYKRYEISNFALLGYECKHNLKYWKREKYLGFGPSAASFYPERKLRTINIASLSRYIKEFPTPKEYDFLDEEKERIERIYLGLRANLMSLKELERFIGRPSKDLLRFFNIKETLSVKSEYLHIFDRIVEMIISTK